LYDHVNRFRVLHIHAPNSNITDTILSSISLSKVSSSEGNPAPHLEELRLIEDMGSRNNALSNYPEYGFHPAPRLTWLILSASGIPPPSSNVLSTITTLSIVESAEDAPPIVEAVLDTIGATPHLKSFNYSAVHVHSYQITANIAHHRLVKVFQLSMVDINVPGCGLDILRCLDAPHLTSVSLNGARDDDEDEGEEEWVDGDVVHVSIPLMRLPEHAPCIRRLNLDSIHYMRSETFICLLNQAQFVQLEELRVADSPINDAALTHSGSPSPHLRQLELRDCAAITGDALIHYITRGKPTWPTCFQLLIGGCPGVWDRDLERLSQLVHVNQFPSCVPSVLSDPSHIAHWQLYCPVFYAHPGTTSPRHPAAPRRFEPVRHSSSCPSSLRGVLPSGLFTERRPWTIHDSIPKQLIIPH
jgi:hypothetical protein